jgi:DNA-directed RNA polymerase subunit F
MKNPKVLSEKPVTMAEMAAEIEKIKKRDGELNFRATKTEEYLQQFELPSEKKIEELKKKIDGLNVPRLKEEHIVKIVDLMPKTTDEMKIIMSAYTISITQDNMKKIVSAINE